MYVLIASVYEKVEQFSNFMWPFCFLQEFDQSYIWILSFDSFAICLGLTRLEMGKIHRQQQAHEEKKVLFRGHSKVFVEEELGVIFSHLFYKHVTIQEPPDNH